MISEPSIEPPLQNNNPTNLYDGALGDVEKIAVEVEQEFAVVVEQRKVQGFPPFTADEEQNARAEVREKVLKKYQERPVDPTQVMEIPEWMVKTAFRKMGRNPEDFDNE